MTRKLLIAGGILAVILIVAVRFLGSNLDASVKKAITRIGPEMTGVSVDVDKVGIALADGRGEIGGLVIGNPRGYKGPHAFKLGSIVLALDKSSETADVVVIKELTIDAPDVVYDKGENGSNVEAIQRNIDEYGKTHGGEEKDQASNGAAAAKRFIIESLQISNGKIRLTDRDTVMDLPTLQLRNVGKSQGGMTGGDIAAMVVKQLTQATVASAARALAQEGVKQAVDDAKGRRRGR